MCSALFSIDAASFGSSTMHRTVRSRLSSRQIRQQVALGDVAALPAEHDATLRLHDRVGEPFGVVGRRLDQPERQPLRRLRADARQPRQLVDQTPGSGPRTRQAFSRVVGHGLGAEHLLDPTQRLCVVCGRVVFLDRLDVRRVVAGAGLAHDA